MWPRVLAPSSPKAAASGAPPQPTESMTRRKARGIRRSARWIERRLGRARASCDAVGGADPGARRPRAPPRVAAWMRASGVSGSTAAPRPSRLSRPTAWSIASAARRRPPPSSTTARPRPRVSMRGDEAVAAGGHVGDHRRAGEVRLEAVEEVGRAAERRDHAVEALGGGAGVEGHRASARRPSAASAARPPSARSSAAERDGHVPEPAVDDVAAQEARGVRHLERVAGGGRQRLVHVGDQRARCGSRRRSPPRPGSRPARGRRRASP